MKKTLFIALFCAAAALCARPAAAESFKFNPHDWQLRLRGIDVMPQETSSVSIAGAKVEAGNRLAPELDISYFFNDNISAELILATTKHNMSLKSPSLDLGSVWVLPPTLTLQYHFVNKTPFVPYVGAGLNYTFFYNADSGAASSISYENHIGYALQAGMDYKLDDHWMLNADVKKIYLKTKATVGGPAATATVHLDPWVVGLGVGYRF